MAGEVICWVGDGSTPSSSARAKAVIRDIGSTPNIFVFGGDVYQSGTALEYVNFNEIYGSTAPSQTPAGVDMRAKMYHTPGNHEYVTYNATTLRADETDTYWTTHAATTLMGAPSTSLTDPNAAYSGMSSADAQKTAAAQWSHFRYQDVGVWRLMYIDAAIAGAVEGLFPTAGDYYDTVANLVNEVEQRRLIVFTHFPRWSAGSSHGDRSGMGPLWSLIAPKAMALVGGHDHCYQRHQPRNAAGSVVTQKNGCVQIVSGNGGTSLNTNDTGYTPALLYGDDTKWGYLKITLIDDDSASFSYVSVQTTTPFTAVTEDTATLDVADPAVPPEILSTTIPDLKQHTNGSTGSGTTSVPLTLPSAPVSGNLLVLIFAGDKNTGTIDTWAAANGWTVEYSAPTTNVSYYYLYKVSAGTEQSITPAVSVAGTAGLHAWYGELEDTVSPGSDWRIIGKALNPADTANVNSWSTGTTEALQGVGLGIAGAAIDSWSTFTSGDSWTNSYASIFAPGTSTSGRPGLWVSAKDEAVAEVTTNTTFSYTGTADQAAAALIVFAKYNPPGPASQNISITNTGGATLNWTASKTQSWLSITPTSGTTTSETDTITVTADPDGLTAGVYNDTITITDSGATNSPQTVAVTFNVVDGSGTPVAGTDTLTLSETSITLSSSAANAETHSMGEAVSVAVVQTASDLFSILTEAAVKLETLGLSVTDALTLTDGASVSAALAALDSWGLTDTSTTNVAASVSDLLTLGDTSELTSTLSLSVSEAFALAELAVAAEQRSISLVDAFAMSESAASSQLLTLSLVDSWVLAEAAAIAQAAVAADVLNTSETSSLANSLSATEGHLVTDDSVTQAQVSALDAIVFTDLSESSQLLTLSLTDALVLSEVANVVGQALFSANDTASTAESIQSLSSALALIDQTVVSEAVSAAITASRTDTLTLTEILANAGELRDIAVTDTQTLVSEIISAALSIGISDSWAMTEGQKTIETSAADIQTIGEALSIAATLIASDALSLSLEVQTSGDTTYRDVSDALLLVESAILASTTLKTVSDLITGSESYQLTSLLDLADLSSMGELLSIAATASTSDTFGVTDVLGLAAEMAVSDASSMQEFSMLNTAQFVRVLSALVSAAATIGAMTNARATSASTKAQPTVRADTEATL